MLQHGIALGQRVLGGDARELVGDLIEFLDEQFVVIKLGTICSGSEILFTMTPHLEAAIRVCSQVTVKLEHAWACEADLGKAEWIAANFDVPYIFLDVGELSSEHGAQEYLTGTKCHPPPVDVGGRHLLQRRVEVEHPPD